MQNSLYNLTNKLKEAEQINLNLKRENEIFKQKIDLLEAHEKTIQTSLEDKISEIKIYTTEITELKQLLDEEKLKSKNLLNLIKDLEKKKSSEKLEKESKLLKDQVQLLTGKLKEFEIKYKAKLENKDALIAKLDSKLSEYENILSQR